MVSINLDRAWISDPLNPAVSVQLLWRGERSFDDEMEGEVRRYANGRGRATTVVGALQTVSGNFAGTDDDLQQLREWKGKTILYRDGTGARIFGAFFTLPWQPAGEGGRDIKLDISEVTYIEQV